MARPTKYTPELLEAAHAYADGMWRENGDAVPTVVGLAIDLGIDEETAHRWGKEKGKEEFSKLLTRVKDLQHRHLVNKGLNGETNPAITKMMMTKHGYSDKVEQDHTSSDGSMTPKVTTYALPDNGRD